MVKKRKIQQESEAESKGALLTAFKEWIVNPLDNDFGFDFEVRLTDRIDKETQGVSEISFYIQNKSSIHSHDEKAVEDLGIDDWILYVGQMIPVLIVKYDVREKVLFWEIAQTYLWDTIEKDDANWKNQKTKRITFLKKVNNLDDIKAAILSAQKRITRYHSLNLGIGEGISINEKDLKKVSVARTKFLDEYKALSLKESYLERKKGNIEKSIQVLQEVYDSPKNDEAKVRAIIGLIYELNVAVMDENKQIVIIGDEAIQICESLNLNYLKDFVTILRSQAILFIVIKKMSEIQMSLKIQNLQGAQLFSFFYTQEFKKLNEYHQSIIKEVNSSLLNLLNGKDFYYYLA